MSDETRYNPYTKQFFSDEIYRYLENLPPEFKDSLVNIEFLVEDLPPDGLKTGNPGIGSSTLGLYSGVPLPSKSIFQKYSLPDIIYVFRLPVLNYHKKSKKSVSEIIQGVLRHEIAHYFGYSDSDLHSQQLYYP